MLPEHTQNIQNGFLFFLVTGIALLVPAVTFHYFRFGRVEPRRTFVFTRDCSTAWSRSPWC